RSRRARPACGTAGRPASIRHEPAAFHRRRSHAPCHVRAMHALRWPTALLLCALTAPAMADDAKPPPIDDALKQASTSGKPLVIEFFTDWCKPCHLFADHVLPDPKVQAALGKVVWVRYDAEAEPGIAAAARFHVSSYPSFLVVDRTGEVRRRSSGIADGAEGV